MVFLSAENGLVTSSNSENLTLKNMTHLSLALFIVSDLNPGSDKQASHVERVLVAKPDAYFRCSAQQQRLVLRFSEKHAPAPRAGVNVCEERSENFEVSWKVIARL